MPFSLSLPIVVSAVFVFIALSTIHGMGGPHGRHDCRGTVTFGRYVVAYWQNWIRWGNSTRFTVTHSPDGIIYAVITGATFGWLWPH